MKYLFAVFLSLLLWSCSTAKKSQTTSSLYTNEQEWSIKIKDGWLTAKTLSLGLYTTSSRKNGLAETTFIKDPKDAFNFYLTGNGEHLLVQTMTTNAIAFSNRDLPPYLSGLPGNTTLHYTLINGTKNEPLNRWEMILKPSHYLELNENKPVGVLRSAGTDIRITAHNHFGKVNSYENVCYEFQYRRQPVAAVIPGNTPRAWVSKEIGTELAKTLAAAIAALL
ncbi:hypothetical protein ACDQ55_03490 [Chitinophaga sp. 30R24]|uniref:hypothetical protein n=1 Tax=Chitinophaga sp. 30R24 TaxID=3248838 RepID=UPI003B90F02B